MKGQRIHDSVFLKINSERYTPPAHLPGFHYWDKEYMEWENMLEIGVSIVLVQKYISDLKQVMQENFSTLDDTLQAIEKFMSTGKLVQFEYYTLSYHINYLTLLTFDQM